MSCLTATNTGAFPHTEIIFLLATFFLYILTIVVQPKENKLSVCAQIVLVSGICLNATLLFAHFHVDKIKWWVKYLFWKMPTCGRVHMAWGPSLKRNAIRGSAPHLGWVFDLWDLKAKWWTWFWCVFHNVIYSITQTAREALLKSFIHSTPDCFPFFSETDKRLLPYFFWPGSVQPYFLFFSPLTTPISPRGVTLGTWLHVHLFSLSSALTLLVSGHRGDASQVLEF